MKRSVIVFDFDGTLADTFPLIRDIYNDMAAKRGWTPLTDEAYQQLRKGSISEARKWSGIRWWQFPLIVRSATKMLKMESVNVDLFPGIVELIGELKNQGAELYVLSRNRRDTVEQVLARYKLNQDMTVLSLQRRQFRSKRVALRKLVRDNGYKRDNIWMVGDEIRDITAARQAGVGSIGVTWGVQDASILARFKPTHLVQTVDELRKTL